MEKRPSREKRRKAKEKEEANGREELLKKTEEIVKEMGEIGGKNAQIAIFGRSKDGEKVFSYGNTNPDDVLDRFFSSLPPSELARYKHNQSQSTSIAATHDGSDGRDASEIDKEFDLLFEAPIDGMDLDELEKYYAELMEVGRNVVGAMAKKTAKSSNAGGGGGDDGSGTSSFSKPKTHDNELDKQYGTCSGFN